MIVELAAARSRRARECVARAKRAIRSGGVTGKQAGRPPISRRRATRRSGYVFLLAFFAPFFAGFSSLGFFSTFTAIGVLAARRIDRA